MNTFYYYFCIQKCNYQSVLIAYVDHSNALLFSNIDHRYTIHIDLKWSKKVGTIHLTCIFSQNKTTTKMSSKKGMQNVKQQNALEEQADLEDMRRQYNEAQAKAKVLALAQAQAKAQAQAHTKVGMEASANNHETGSPTSSTLWQSGHNTVQPKPIECHSSIMHMVDHYDSNNALNMRLQNTIKSQRLMVKDCVRTKLFRRLKFFTKGIHDLYDHRPNTVCAMIIANCNATHEEATVTWWSDMCKLIKHTLSDHRNNVIKTMRMRFEGKYKQYL